MKMRWRKQLPGLMDRTNFGRLMEFRLLTVWDIPQAHGNIPFWFDGVITSVDFWSPQQRSAAKHIPNSMFQTLQNSIYQTSYGHSWSEIHGFRSWRIMSWWGAHWVTIVKYLWFRTFTIYIMPATLPPTSHARETRRCSGRDDDSLNFKTITFLETLSWVSFTNPRR